MKASCTAWSECQPGYHESKAGTTTEDRKCVACSAGFTFNDAAGEKCRTCSDCVEGEYLPNHYPTGLQPTIERTP